MTRTPILSLALILLALATVSGMAAQAADADSSQAHTVSDTGAGEIPAVAQVGTVLYKDGNVTITDTTIPPPHIPDGLTKIAGEAAALTDWNDTDLSDMYYDPATDRIRIVATTPEGNEVAKQFASRYPNQVGIDTGPLSHLQLKDAGRDLVATNEFLSSHARELGVSRGGRGVDVVVDSLPADPDELIEAASKYPFDVTFILDNSKPVDYAPFDEDRRHDVSPYAGGLGYIVAIGSTFDYQCSGAFGYRETGTDFMLTAGHCYRTGSSDDRMYMLDAGSTWTDPALGVWAGNWNGRSSMNSSYNSIQVNGAYHGDVALVNLSQRSHAAGDSIWDGGPSTTNKSDVYNRFAPFLDLYLCRGGATSGSSCGTLRVTGVNLDIQVAPGQWLREADKAFASNSDECSFAGDSGGSVYAYRTSTTVSAVGVVSGHTTYSGGSCQQRFTGAEEAVQAWGGDVRQTG